MAVLVAAKRKLVRVGTTVEQIVQSISDMILAGLMKPGDRLDEPSLAARFDVSRTPVREAIRQLCAMNLLVREPNRSAVVVEVSQQHLASMFEAMAELERICARLCAARMDLDERRRLQEEHLCSEALVRRGAELEYEAHNTQFHTALYRGAHSPHLYEIAASTRARLAPFRRAQFRIPGRLSRSFAEHQAIVGAILAEDGDAAAHAAFVHMELVGDASATMIAHDQSGIRKTRRRA